MHQSGLIQFAEKRSTPLSRKRCSVSEIQKVQAAKAVALGLDELNGAFFVLVVGMTASFCTFLAEVIIGKFGKRLRIHKIQKTSKKMTL